MAVLLSSDLVSAPNAPNGSGQDGRTATSNFYETPDNLAPRGVAAIEFGPLPPLTVSFDAGPDGAMVTWRPRPDPDSLADGSRWTMFIEQNERWLVYRCCP